MKNYDFIYVNGDSYSAKSNTSKVYSDYISELTGLPVINQAVSGSNNQRIFRSSLETLLNNQGKKILCITGLSFVTRDEIWYEDQDQHILQKIPDLETNPYNKLITADWILPMLPWSEAHDRLVDININRQLAHFYTGLFCYKETLCNMGFDYLIFSAADNSGWRNESLFYFDNLKIVQNIKDDNRVLPIKNFSVRQWAEERSIPTTETYHLFEDGHKIFADFLLQKIEEIF
jgi:hypothetical protein